jgi:hypothetical protein
MLPAFQILWADLAGGNETHERRHRRSIAAPPRHNQVPSRIRMSAVCATLRENA